MGWKKGQLGVCQSFVNVTNNIDASLLNILYNYCKTLVILSICFSTIFSKLEKFFSQILRCRLLRLKN